MTREQTQEILQENDNLDEGEESHAMLQEVAYRRGLGLLFPLFSLPGPYGIGSMGEAAYRFCDFLRQAGFRYWQLLPLGPTGYGDSPYSSFSSAAGNPYFIDLPLLVEQGLLTREEVDWARWTQDDRKVPYGDLSQHRLPLLRKAFSRFLPRDHGRLQAFCRTRGPWLKEYACYMAIKEDQEGRAWAQWPAPLRDHDPDALRDFEARHSENVLFMVFLQYQFFRQWEALSAYAHERGISIIGDLPIYVAYDSADCWANQEDFLFDETRAPLRVAGAPPDQFTEEGQRWGNPLYRWDRMKEQGYSFWKWRISSALALYDILRLDHFIGFAHYWSVDAGEATAKHGHWVPGPGLALFQELEKALGPLPILVEDLGALSNEVIRLRQRTGFPGMKPLQFAFGGDRDSAYLPHNYAHRTAVYTSTHDTQTLRSWWEGLDDSTRDHVCHYFRLREEDLPGSFLQAACASVADLCIYSLQDLLWIGEEGRINRPGSLGGNWVWRMREEDWEHIDPRKIQALAALYGR